MKQDIGKTAQTILAETQERIENEEPRLRKRTPKFTQKRLKKDSSCTRFAREAFTHDEQQALGEYLCLTPNPAEDLAGAIAHSRRAAHRVPDRILRAVTGWQHDGTAPGMMIVTNSPCDPALPSTPTNGRSAGRKDTFVSEGRLLLAALLLGEPFGYASERSGDIIHNTAPIPGSETSGSSSGSRVLLEAHTEVTACRFQRASPEYLVLTFNRGDPEAATLFADARAIYQRLRESEREMARGCEFRTPIPESFTRGLGGGFSARMFSHPHPIFCGPEEDPEIIFDGGATVAATTEGERLLKKIQRMLLDPELFKPAVGMPGDLFLINNRRGIHGRTAFHPVYNGVQRWPQRVYVMSPGAIHDNRQYFDPSRRVFVQIPVPE